MSQYDRKSLMKKFQQMAREQRPIIGGGAGTGLSAKCEELGGIDLIIIYNSGRYRMAGRGSLAGLLSYGNANNIVVEMAREVLPAVRQTPVLAGVNGTDPFCLFDVFLDDLLRMGFSGVQNFPTVGLIDGVFRANIEETGMGYALEVDMIRLAHQKGLLTTPYIFDEHQAVAMTEAGADILVAHMGLTIGGSIGAETALSLNDCVQRINRMAAAAMQVRPDILVLCHGGPIVSPDDAQYILESCPNCHGFFGASSMERLPTEDSIIAQTRAFKAIEQHSKKEINMTHKIHVTETIKAPIEEVWDIIGPFNGLPEYHPAIQASYIEDNKGDGNTVGSIRYLTLDGGFVREKLLKFDPKTFTFEYAIIESSLPVENYQAGVRLSRDKNNHTLCEWWADFTITDHPAPEELVEMIGTGVFKAGFQAAAQLCNVCA